MSETGRPLSYKDEYREQAAKLSELGLTDAQMADFFEVSIPTFNSWKAKHPDFFKSLKAGKEIADENVVRSLYNRAVGYDHPEDKIFQYNGKSLVVPTIKHVPPDPGAAKLWLTNRRPEEWREKVAQEVTGKDGGPIETKVNDSELARQIAFALAKGDPSKDAG